MSLSAEHYLDCRGLSCPVPIVRVSRAMKALAVGERLRIDASDAAFPADLEAWLSTRTDRLVSLEQEGNQQRAVIEKSEPV